MEIILLEDVKSLGKKGELVKVSDGYARNYILPKKLGVEATAKSRNDLKLRKAVEERHAKKLYEDALAFADDIREKSVTVRMKCGEGGRVFGSVSGKEIVAAFKEQLGIDIDKKKLLIAEPIKALGGFVVEYKVHPKVNASLSIKVEEE